MEKAPNSPEHKKGAEPKLETKRYLVVMLVLVVLVVSTFVVSQFLLSSSVPVPEGGVYVVGEKMVYDYNATYVLTNGTNSVTYKLTTDVIGFDGKHYTLKHTTWLEGHEISYITKTDLKGKTVELEGGNSVDSADKSPFPVYGSDVQFPNNEVSVSESWQVPVHIEREGATTEGTIRYTFSEITTVTVPAGTYDILKIDAEISDLTSTGVLDGKAVHSERSISGHILLEKDSHLLVAYETVELSNATTGSGEYSGKTIMHVQLTQHTT